MDTQQENRVIQQIKSAIRDFTPSITLDPKPTLDNVRNTIRVFMRNHPEIFWFSNQYRYNETSGIIELKYNFTEEKAKFFEGEIKKVLFDDFQIEHVKTLSESERLVYVYKWISNRTVYNEYSSFNQTIFSVLVNRNSVCTGYAKTAQYLLSLIGIESRLVFGKFLSDKSQNGRHGWNIIKIDGKWMHVDFSLANKTLRHLLNRGEAPLERESILWNYFCVSTEKILEYIDNADLFVLCWSKNAAESEWVQIERKYALDLIERGNQRLSIYPLSMPPEAPLPEDMSDKYNFATL